MSAGDLLREERNTPGSDLGEMIETHIRNGTIVPVEVTCSLLEKAMKKHVALRSTSGDTAFGPGKFLIDGFPRNQDNFDGWKKVMADKVHFNFVLFFDCSDDVCVRRCLDRGAAGSGRSDDNEESLRKRMKTFESDTLPIVNYYRTLSKVKDVDGSKEPDQVYEDVKKLFQ